jgi:hypothetical protein
VEEEPARQLIRLSTAGADVVMVMAPHHAIAETKVMPSAETEVAHVAVTVTVTIAVAQVSIAVTHVALFQPVTIRDYATGAHGAIARLRSHGGHRAIGRLRAHGGAALALGVRSRRSERRGGQHGR